MTIFVFIVKTHYYKKHKYVMKVLDPLYKFKINSIKNDFEHVDDNIGNNLD